MNHGEIETAFPKAKGQAVTFEGSRRSKLDGKGRMAVPAGYRGQLDPKYGNTLVVTRGYEGCLVLFPPEVWDARQKKVESRLGRKYEDPRVRKLLRVLSANTETVTMDSQGRILVPEHLRDMAGLVGEALVLGVGNRMEVWDPARYQSYEDDVDLGTYEELAAEFLADEPLYLVIEDDQGDEEEVDE